MTHVAGEAGRDDPAVLQAAVGLMEQIGAASEERSKPPAGCRRQSPQR
jgi:hypothetical protein